MYKKTNLNSRHFLLGVLLLSFSILLTCQYFSNTVLKTYTDAAFCFTTLAIVVVVYFFIKEINSATVLHNTLYLRETQLRETLNSLEEGVITTDMDAKIQSMNPSAVMLTGWENAEAANLPLEKVYNVRNEETGKTFDNIVSRVLKEGKSIEFENNTILRRKNGDELIISNSGAPIRDINGKIVGVVLTFRNITDRKKMEEQQSLFSSIIRSSNDAIISKNFEGRITSWNDAAERTFGYTPEEAIGKSILMLFPPDRYHEEKEIITIVKSGLPIEHFETVRQKKDGSHINVSLSISPVLNSKGKVIGISKIARDITELKKSESELRKSHELIQKLTSEIPVAVYQFVMTPEGEASFPFMSKVIERLIPDTTVEQINENGPFATIHPDDLPVFLKSVEQSRQHLTLWQQEFRSVDSNGDYKWLLASSLPEKTDDGTVVWYGYIQDINERKKAEAAIQELNEKLEEKVKQRTAELTEANAALEAFSYSVSHDLRSPARSVVSFAKIISNTYGDTLNEQVKDLLNYITDSGNRMNAIIEDLLLLAKIGKEKLRITEVNMGDVFKETWHVYKLENPHNAELQIQNLPKVNADESMLKQVAFNLISNAVKYSSKSEKPVVRIGYEIKDEKLIFCVADNGAGFDMKNYHILFSTFQRLHDSSEFEGTGIGLVITKNIISRHGGEVWAEGKLGEGAKFYFSLPLKG